MTTAVVFITGASSGIGRETALAFARAGYHVCGLARRQDRLAALGAEIAELPGAHGQFLAVAGDVRDAEAVEDAVRQTVDKFGRLDVLVANAGIGHSGSVVEADWGDLETVMGTNIDGVLHGIRACVPAMRALAGGGGQILIVSSIVAAVHTPYTATYAASKAFVSSLAGSLRLELEDDDIQVTDLLVGRTLTDFNVNRLGPIKRGESGLPTMGADQVAEAIVRAARRRRKRVVFRFFDRLVLLGGMLVPGVMARLAKRQYQPQD
ncbi:MAG: SDR family NAD(P)-dependent oxidoreductase [Chloroflexota bacterium]|nr:SDR family NAD(P)-dependent oxidoreductase [Chloroflexota bacterium]